MRRGLRVRAQLDAQPVAGDEPAGGGDQHGNGNVARRRVGEQDAQRIALIEV